MSDANNDFPPRPDIPPRATPIETGDSAPDFTLPAVSTDGSVFTLTLSDYVDGGSGLLVFYQDDGMPICTSELKAFAQEHELLREAGIRVVGMNTNGIGSHQKFQERDAFPFPLVSDFHGDVVKGYGLWDEDEGKSRRAVVALDANLKVTFVAPHFNPGAITIFEDIFDSLGVGPATD